MAPELTKLTINSTALITDTMTEQTLHPNIAHTGQQLLQHTIDIVSAIITITGINVQIAITNGYAFIRSSEGPFLYASIFPKTGICLSLSFRFEKVSSGSNPHQK